MYKALAITTGIGCDNRCAYCPQEKLINAYRKRSGVMQMSLDTFKQCIEKVPRNVYIHFIGFVEPWANPECSEMVLYAHKAGFKIKVHTTLSGMELTDIDLICEIPFSEFVVHLPDDRGQTRIEVNEKYLNLLARLTDNIRNIEYQLNHGPSAEEKVHPKLKSFFENKHIRIWAVNTRAGNVVIGGKQQPEKITGRLDKCFRLRINIMLPNGDVTLCCMDWGLKHILGNLLDSDYKALFKSREYSKIREGLDEGSSDILCRYCDIAPVIKSVPGRIITSFFRNFGMCR